MKMIQSIDLPLLASAISFIGCAKISSNSVATPTATTQPGPIHLSRLEVSNGSIPGPAIPLELTTTEIWNRLHVQVFAFTGSYYDDQAYIVRDRRAFPIGEEYGGEVTSLCVADLDNDRNPELLFCYSYGTGFHQCRVGVWTGGTSWTVANIRTNFPVLNLILKKIDDHHVRIIYEYYDHDLDLMLQGEFGNLHLSSEANPALTVVLDPHLPKAILARTEIRP